MITENDIIDFCFHNAWNNKCDAACEPHVGECSVVHVEKWGHF